MEQTTAQLVSLLARYGYRKADVQLASGRSSRFYIDAKQVTYRPEGVALVGRAVLEQIRPFEVAAVGGPTIGADPIVASTVMSSTLDGRPLSGFVIRKEAKMHGLQKQIEGVAPAPGSRVAIVEDVVTSGGSVLRAVEVAREVGLQVAVVVPLVDREEGAAEAFARADVAFRPICTLSEVLRATKSSTKAPPPAPS